MKKFVIALLIPLLIGMLACNLPWAADNAASDEAAALQQTLTTLQTEVAAAPIGGEDTTNTEEDISTEEPAPQPVPTNTPNPPDFLFEGVSFNYGPDIAVNAWGEVVPEYIPEYEGIERSEPEHIWIHFNDYIDPLYYHDAKILVYPVDRLVELDEYTYWHVSTLQSLVAHQPAEPTDFPFIPVWNAAALFHSNISSIDFDNGSGIRYLTQYGQAYWPINNTGIFYTFQGITADGRFYVSAILPINHPNLLDTGDEVGNDWAPYYDENAWNSYIAEQTDMLNAQTPQSFTPSLQALDDMIKSLMVNR